MVQLFDATIGFATLKGLIPPMTSTDKIAHEQRTFWKATVNGKATPVYKANLAYKAIKLEHGLNKIHFYF